MKKLSAFLAGIFLLFLSLSASAQSQNKADYFTGKWDVLVEGTPNGDTKMIVSLQRKDSTLTGVILDSTDQEIAKITKVEEKDKSVTLYFTAQGYDVYLLMEKKDDDHVTGNLMDMFEAKGDRIKAKEVKSK
jgi:hypothetical protein